MLAISSPSEEVELFRFECLLWYLGRLYLCGERELDFELLWPLLLLDFSFLVGGELPLSSECWLLCPLGFFSSILLVGDGERAEISGSESDSLDRVTPLTSLPPS